MEDKEFVNPQTGEKYQKKEKPFWKEWKFWVYSIIAVLLFIVSASSMTTACHAIRAGVGSPENSAFVQERKSAKGITDRGGFDKYSFTLDCDFSALGNNAYKKVIYSFDVATATPTIESTNTYSIADGQQAAIIGLIDSEFASLSVDIEEVKMLTLTGKTNYYGGSGQYTWFYISFKQGSVPLSTTTSMKWYNFIDISSYLFPLAKKMNSAGWAWSYPQRFTEPVVLSYEKNDLIYLTGSDWSGSVPRDYQDIASYYQELGYSTGYDAGESDGYAEGHADGYGEGYNSGHSDGYAEGYQDATDDYNTGIAFTSYGLYANAPLTLVADEVIGNFSYMYLFDYATSIGDEHNVYALFTTNVQTGAYNGYIVDRDNNPTSTLSETIGSFSNQATADVVITAEKDMYFELYTGYITSFHNRGEADLKAFWFSGGSSGTALQNYSDGYDHGFADGDSAGYNRGYAVGSEVGYANGVNAADPESLTNTLVAVFQQPFDQIYRFFNFNVLGLNILGLVTGLITIFVVIKVVKKII